VIALRKLRMRLRKRVHSGEEGVALIMVLGVIGVMSLVIFTAVYLTVGTLNKSDNDQDWNAALAAAFGGLEEYQNRLAEEPGYVQYGNPASGFSSTSTVHLPTTTNLAFGLGATGTWAVAHGPDLPDGSPGPDLFHYRYEVDNSTYSATGNIRLRATGQVGAQTRSVVADVRQDGFIDYVYFTDYEYQDPTSVSPAPSPACATVHNWEGSGRTSACRIYFLTGDAVHGPLHSNDSLFICGGTTFDSTITTSKPGGGYSGGSGATGCTTSTPTFTGGAPVFAKAMPMPATNGELIKETRTDISDEVPRPGCLYTGPTMITFLTNGKMTVKSPWTKVVNISNALGTSGDNSAAGIARCGSVSDLKSAAGATIDVPENNVVYVQNIPLSGDNGATTADTQTTLTSQTKNGVLMCKKPDGTIIGNGSTSANSYPYAQNVVGYPVNGGTSATTEKPLVIGTGATASYGCRNGDVFVSGTNAGGAITIAAQNYIYVTADLTYGNVDTDMTGLVGQNAVWVYNPVNNNSTPSYMISAGDRTVKAAILSVQHTFAVQNYTIGDRGTLTVYGSIAQKFRGIVSSGTNGYTKSYSYDPRFRHTAPPKFLSPVTTTYGINVWVEISPVFKADGTCSVYKPDGITCA
jgi:hypothetical protein